MNFYKISATQNSFFFIEEKHIKNQNLPENMKNLSRNQLAKFLCFKLGTGADGMVIIKESHSNADFDFEWDFYNSDGSSAEMCGNASRCVMYFAKHFLGFSKSELKFKSIAGIISVRHVGENIFSVKMPSYSVKNLWEKEIFEDQTVEYCIFDTGVPHVVMEVPNLKKESLLRFVKKFRYPIQLNSKGANVSFYARHRNSTGDSISIDYEGITFERGVENFTASCGTGVVAMALAIVSRSNLERNQIQSVKINTPGGELRVEIDSNLKLCNLVGPAKLDEFIEVY